VSNRGLSRVTTAELARLASAVDRGVLSAPLRDAELRAEGFASDELLPVLEDLDRAALVRLLRAWIADRERRPPPRLDLVWTGPETRGATSRDTAVLVRELFAKARRSVLIAGFSFDHGRAIFAPLHEVMRVHGVTTEIFIDIRERAPAGVAADAHARAYVEAFLTRSWPFGPPFPSLYYDPRSAASNAMASLHAKCIVVDLERTFVTSANFTDRGQTRNIELGVQIDDREFAAAVVTQWRSLVEAGLLGAAR
jgi:phosphatidylserine/phosphatidylglycerophosphate/cardiolipin synthase-like enzyme